MDKIKKNGIGLHELIRKVMNMPPKNGNFIVKVFLKPPQKIVGPQFDNGFAGLPVLK